MRVRGEGRQETVRTDCKPWVGWYFCRATEMTSSSVRACRAGDPGVIIGVFTFFAA